ncbi:DUF4386 domain-containing protein [Micromonospora phytophila]|uniref:DUF4386 domain-containing protein n=1 Tax=Micromonospora phytophila TaxID=709888 RepID=UPI00202E1E1C|nr:DUF4386 domain-containing protein [Micromonospora phytophila]MCM0673696.1 DUF4386 domain-containing protein [Micromonospora phytophila]
MTAGVFFLITEITAIAGLVLYGPVLSDANYIVGAGADDRVLTGGFLELLLVVAVIGTAVTLYPVVKRQHHSIALGYLCSRLLEAAIIVVGILSVLSVVTLRQDLAGAVGTDQASLVTVGTSLVAIHDWTFLFGPNFALGANSLLLAYLMYRSRLVPRFIAVLGLVGGPLICASATAVMFGLYDQISTWGSIAALPVFAWEVSLAAYLILRGFKPSPVSAPSGPMHTELSAA